LRYPHIQNATIRSTSAALTCRIIWVSCSDAGLGCGSASLNDELLKDYKSFLIQRGLRVWHKESPEALATRARLKHDVVSDLPPAKPGAVRLTGLAGLAAFVAEATPELAANAMLCAVNQAAYPLKRQVQSQGRDFLEHGGFTENLYAARVRARQGQSTAGALTNNDRLRAKGQADQAVRQVTYPVSAFMHPGPQQG
jgi:four helix bundle suffix protein